MKYMYELDVESRKSSQEERKREEISGDVQTDMYAVPVILRYRLTTSHVVLSGKSNAIAFLLFSSCLHEQ
jgi:hypothetical protein